jgi:hypothetical protein
MSAQLTNRIYLGPQTHRLAKDLQLRLPVHNRAAQRVLRLKPGNQHKVFFRSSTLFFR